ncbi:MAG: DUF1552 domain-containing protein [Nannocystales bacterium]
MSRSFDRRSLFKLLAASSVGSMLPWLHSPQARGGGADSVPLRILFVELGHGFRRGTWEPTVSGALDPLATETTTDWTLRPKLSALEPYRERINMFYNLDMVSSKVDPTAAANAHIDGQTHYMTSEDRIAADLGGGVSIDQLIAQGIADSGVQTRLRSLELLADENSIALYNETSDVGRYAIPGERLPAISHPPLGWDHIFPKPLSTDLAAQQRHVAKKTSAYNYIRGDYERLVARLGGEDRTKIESMLDLRSDLHNALTLFNDRDANRPDRGDVLAPYEALDDGADGSPGNPKWSVKSRVQSQLMAAALHTDTTRVGNLIFRWAPYYQTGYADGMSFGGVSTLDFHDLVHKASGDVADISDPTGLAVVDDAEVLEVDLLRNVLDTLATLPETDGQTMLEHTLVVVVHHIGEGSHDLTRIPFFTIGDAHGSLSTGNYVRFPATWHDDPTQVGQFNYPEDWGDRLFNHKGRPHGDLFATLAQAMGLDVSTFGRQMPESRGLISEILA